MSGPTPTLPPTRVPVPAPSRSARARVLPALLPVLEELDFGDEPGLAKALPRVADTRDPLLEFCAV